MKKQIVRLALNYARSLEPLKEDGYHNSMIDMVNWTLRYNRYYESMRHDAGDFENATVFGYVFGVDHEENTYTIRKQLKPRRSRISIIPIFKGDAIATWIGVGDGFSDTYKSLQELQSDFDKDTQFKLEVI